MEEIDRDWGKIVFSKNEQHWIPKDEEGNISIEHQISINCFCEPEMQYNHEDGTTIVLHNHIIFH